MNREEAQPMDGDLIEPFVSSIRHVFSTMFQLPVQVGTPAVKEGNKCSHDVSGIIGLSGSYTGTVVLSMPSETAVAITALFTGHRLDADSDEFADAVGEMVNIVCGNAKAALRCREVSISCPSVVVGKNHRVAFQTDSPRVVVPCSTDCGEIVLEVAIRPAGAEAPLAA